MSKAGATIGNGAVGGVASSARNSSNMTSLSSASSNVSTGLQSNFATDTTKAQTSTSMSNNHAGGRGWLEGTLDVISGLQQAATSTVVPRPGTPTSSTNPSHRRQNSSGSQVSGPGVSASFTHAASAFIKRTTFSAPNSPARNGPQNGTAQTASNPANQPAFNPSNMTISRLPSQDSMDQILHNDSNHGGRNVSSAQVIRDLKQSNARLTARMAAMEADFLNQLTQQQMTHRDFSSQVEERWMQKERAIFQQWENRCKAAENRIREREEQLQKVKEESAFQRHTISDLKKELQLLKNSSRSPQNSGVMRSNSMGSSKVGATACTGALSGWIGNGGLDVDAVREMQALQDEARQEREERIRIQQELSRLQRYVKASQAESNQELGVDKQAMDRTREALYRTETAFIELKKDHHRMQQQQEREVQNLEEELKSSKETWQKKEQLLKSKVERLEHQRDTNVTNDLQEQLIERDETIQNLRNQILDYSKQLTDLTSELAQVRADAEAQEQYRRDEADDLRVLNDAQEEEIDMLRKRLEDALREIEAREHELEEKKDEKKDDGCSLGTNDLTLNNNFAISNDLSEARKLVKILEDELNDLRADHADETSNYEDIIVDLKQKLLHVEENYAADKQFISRNTSFENCRKEENSQTAEYRAATDELADIIEDLEHKLEKTEIQLAEVRRALKLAEENEKNFSAGYEKRINNLEQEKYILEQRHNETVNALESQLAEMKRLQASSSTQQNLASNDSEKSNNNAAQIEELMKQILTLQSKMQTQTSHGRETEEKLLAELEAAKQAEAKAVKELKDFSDLKKAEIQDLLEKLEDRDTTISSLVKSTMSLEQELSATRIDLDAAKSRNPDNGGNIDSTGVYDIILANSTSMDDVEGLRSSLDDSRESEKRLAEECDHLQEDLESARQANSTLRSQIENFKAENNYLRSQLDDDDVKSYNESNISGGSTSLQMQIQERDKAIASLVQRSMEQDRIIADLTKKQYQLTQETQALRAKAQAGPSWDEVKELRKETEMFAGQVIEQDEEIEELRSVLKVKERRIANLEIEIDELKCRPRTPPPPEPILSPRTSGIGELYGDNSDELAEKIVQLSAEIDELTEANNTLRDEIRGLRKVEREHELSINQIDKLKQDLQSSLKQNTDFSNEINALQKQTQDLTSKLNDTRVRDGLTHAQEEAQKKASQTIQSLNKKVKFLENVIERLKADAGRRANVDEMEVETLKSKIDDLRRDLEHQNAAVASAKETIQELESLLAQKNSGEAAALEEEKEELMAELESVSNQLVEAHNELKQLDEQKQIIDDFKMKLEAADEAREVAEREIIDTYERKLSLLKMDKDVTIDKLRNDLTELKQLSAAEVGALTNNLRQYEAEVNQLREEMTSEIRERESRLSAMQLTLQAHEQLVSNMKTEMDHLQGSMENNVMSRREEIESLQQEVADLSATIARQDREIKTLRGQLEDKRIEHELEVVKLNETIDSMQTDNQSERRNALDLQMELRLKEVKDRLEKLKWRNATLHEENEILRDRLQKSEAKLTESSNRNVITEELEKDLEQQKRKVEELSADLRRLREPPTSQSPVPAVDLELTNAPTLDPAATSPLSSTQVPLTPLLASKEKNVSKEKNAFVPSSIAPVKDKKGPLPSRRLGFLGRRRASAQDISIEVTKS